MERLRNSSRRLSSPGGGGGGGAGKFDDEDRRELDRLRAENRQLLSSAGGSGGEGKAVTRLRLEISQLQENLATARDEASSDTAKHQELKEQMSLIQKKLEVNEQERENMALDLSMARAEVRTRIVEHNRELETIRRHYEDTEDEKEELEIKNKEQELRIFLLEEQVKSKDQTPITRLPEALMPDNSVELEGVKKQLKRAKAAMEVMDIQKCDLQLQVDEMKAKLESGEADGSSKGGNASDIMRIRTQLADYKAEVEDWKEKLDAEIAAHKRAVQTAEANSIELEAARLRIQEGERVYGFQQFSPARRSLCASHSVASFT